ncbi:MAG: BsaA family SipW-dependent biofilm matrix protein [Ruminococcus sp.]|nr:BsaA family SipW-dependent biofilm matrix protein [Ruminococcus sp.]
MTNTKQKSKKSAKQKRVLAAAILLAAIITVGASFAWFTSSDTVTNKLSASGSYGVAVTEDFTPVDDWTPGQPVNKDVSTINTGNIDAYVKVTLSNAIDLVVYGTSETYTAGNVANYITLSADEVKSLQAGGRLVCAAGSAVAIGSAQLVGTD